MLRAHRPDRPQVAATAARRRGDSEHRQRFTPSTARPDSRPARAPGRSPRPSPGDRPGCGAVPVPRHAAKTPFRVGRRQTPPGSTGEVWPGRDRRRAGHGTEQQRSSAGSPRVVESWLGRPRPGGRRRHARRVAVRRVRPALPGGPRAGPHPAPSASLPPAAPRTPRSTSPRSADARCSSHRSAPTPPATNCTTAWTGPASGTGPISQPGRPTPVKRRMLAADQILLREDSGDPDDAAATEDGVRRCCTALDCATEELRVDRGGEVRRPWWSATTASARCPRRSAPGWSSTATGTPRSRWTPTTWPTGAGWRRPW